jgi:integrase
MSRRAHGEGSIYKRADGRWVAVLDIGYAGGRRRRKSFYGQTRSEVLGRLIAGRKLVQDGVPLAADRETVSQYLNRWLDEVSPTVRPKTRRSYAGTVRVHLVPTIGHHKLAKLDPQQVQTMLNSKQAAGLSPRSVGIIRAVLRQALNRAVRWGLLARNVAQLTDVPHPDTREPRVITVDDARLLLIAFSTHRLGPLFTIALASGLRQGEVLGLRWEDVDLEKGTLRIERALQYIDGRFESVPPKSARARRTIPLTDIARAAFHRQRAQQLQDCLLAGQRWQETPLVFTTSLGTPLDSRNVTRSLQRCLTDYGLPSCRFHDLRHGCASLLMAVGASPRVAQEILGHADIRTTLGIYSHVAPALMREAAAMLDGALA